MHGQQNVKIRLVYSVRYFVSPNSKTVSKGNKNEHFFFPYPSAALSYELIFKDISQIKHQLDATLCRFYFCRVTLHVSGASAHHQEYLKLVQRPLVHVLSLQVSHHISLLGPFGPNKEM